MLWHRTESGVCGKGNDTNSECSNNKRQLKPHYLLPNEYLLEVLECKPRDPSSMCPHRLADVMAAMERDGILQRRPGGSGGNVWVPGPRYAEFLPQTVPQG